MYIEKEINIKKNINFTEFNNIKIMSSISRLVYAAIPTVPIMLQKIFCLIKSIDIKIYLFFNYLYGQIIKEIRNKKVLKYKSK